MLHTHIIPRLSFAVRPIPGVVDDPLQPLQPRVAGSGVSHAWVICYAHLCALHSLYARLGVRRPLSRLHDLTVSMLPIIQRVAGDASVRSALDVSQRGLEEIDDHLALLKNGREAGWWIVALQASMALGVWYELAPDAPPEDVDFAAHASTVIRRVLRSVFESRSADAIQNAAHGDGEGDLLAQVALNALTLGAPLVGMPADLVG